MCVTMNSLYDDSKNIKQIHYLPPSFEIVIEIEIESISYIAICSDVVIGKKYIRN